MRRTTAPPRFIAPNRIFLDTCTFQALCDCGGFIFGEDEFPERNDYAPGACPQVLIRPDAAEILISLRNIFLFDDRAHFDWIVSRQSLAEIDAAGNHSRSVYARDVIDHSSICLSENPPPDTAAATAKIMSGPAFGFISEKDRQLLVDAAACGCDTFLTIEKRLPRSADAVLRKVPLLIATPERLWTLLYPHLQGL